MSFTMTVPDVVPSVFHNSYPLPFAERLKYNSSLNNSRPYFLVSHTNDVVPAAVPLLRYRQ